MGCGPARAVRYFHDCRVPRGGSPGSELRVSVFLALLLPALLPLILVFCPASAVHAQVVPSGRRGVLQLSAGVFGSGDTLQYGSRKMLGAGTFVDGETTGHFGIEAEGRWIEFHQTANVHAETYSIGGRYHFVFGRFQPYAKGLVGFANFNGPYNLAQGRYLAVTAGGGVDFHCTHRISLRVADFEYQDWPQFTYGNMNALNGSVGLKVRIF